MSESKMYGPQLPPVLATNSIQKSDRSEETDSDGSSEQFPTVGPFIGPLPTTDSKNKSSIADIELSKRAIEIKLKNIEQRSNFEYKAREEWMTELPEIKVVQEVTARSFRTKDRPDFSDRSCWTESPNNVKKISKTASIDKAKKKFDAERDVEQESIAKKHKRKHSLLEIHKEKKKEEKRKKKHTDGKIERRPFSRESDMQVNKSNESKRKAALKNASILDTQFCSGNKKYL